jgi:hypothetical protein
VPLGLEELQKFLANFGRFHRAASIERKRREIAMAATSQA